MLGKLMKQEFRATGRVMLPIFGALLILALLGNISMQLLAGEAGSISAFRVLLVLFIVFFVLGIFATAIMTIVIMVSRFYRNLLKDEGYLMFTLPVNVHEIVWAKLLVSLVWFLVAGLLIWLIVMATVLISSGTNLGEVFRELPSWAEIREVLRSYNLTGGLIRIGLQLLVIAVLSCLASCLHFYAAMSLGHMFAKDKIILSIVFFVVISFLFSIVDNGYILSGMMGNLDASFNFEPETAADGLRFGSMLLWHGILLQGIQAAVLYLATVLSLRRGLNLG
ncbi:MAG: hypothetical protein IJQ02_02715 [Oscillospiraceae bacterium]|nr:hypothetical protein [Oscillospiraceae bacterium]